MINIARHNVGRIAERIVANELEARGFRVSDLNKEHMAANADLVAISPRRILQIQVKGASNPKDPWWVGYGHFTPQIIASKEQILAGNQRIFNRIEGDFYSADYVILVAVRSPTTYSCIVLPIEAAERAAKLHLDAFPCRSGPTHIVLEPGPRARASDHRVAQERTIFADHRDDRGWERLLQSN